MNVRSNAAPVEKECRKTSASSSFVVMTSCGAGFVGARFKASINSVPDTIRSTAALTLVPSEQ